MVSLADLRQSIGDISNFGQQIWDDIRKNALDPERQWASGRRNPYRESAVGQAYYQLKEFPKDHPEYNDALELLAEVHTATENAKFKEERDAAVAFVDQDKPSMVARLLDGQLGERLKEVARKRLRTLEKAAKNGDEQARQQLADIKASNEKLNDFSGEVYSATYQIKYVKEALPESRESQELAFDDLGKVTRIMEQNLSYMDAYTKGDSLRTAVAVALNTPSDDNKKTALAALKEVGEMIEAGSWADDENAKEWLQSAERIFPPSSEQNKATALERLEGVEQYFTADSSERANDFLNKARSALKDQNGKVSDALDALDNLNDLLMDKPVWRQAQRHFEATQGQPSSSLTEAEKEDAEFTASNRKDFINRLNEARSKRQEDLRRGS